MARPATKRITLSDVAEAAGVSAITVSRTLNQPDKVSETVRAKVERAVEDLGYIPNHSASALASSKSGLIGVAIPSLSNSVFTDVLKGVYDVAGPAGYRVLLVDTHYSDIEEERMVKTLMSQSPEAMIITGGSQTKMTRRVLTNSEIPVVQIMEMVADPIDMNLGFSHRQAGYDVVSRLVSAGFQQIGFLGARMDARAQQRLLGYKQAMEVANLPFDNLIMFTPQPSSVATGAQLFRSLMTQCNGELDSLFACNDDLALGAMFECQRMGFNVPGEVAVCGFNDIEMSAMVNPTLSSVYVPRYEMGVQATKMAIKALNGEDFGPKKVEMPYEIKFRESTNTDVLW